jgi:hypothetical protein
MTPLKIGAGLLAVLLILVLAGPAVAKPGNGKGKGSREARIEQAVANSTLTVLTADPTYGGSVDLLADPDWSVIPEHGQDQVRVYVTTVCWDPLTFDPDTGWANVVYQWSKGVWNEGYPQPTEPVLLTFPLIDQAGLDWGGQAADCVALLIWADRPWKREHTIIMIAEVSFSVAGVTAG